MDEQQPEHVDNRIDAYALGALEPDEEARVEAHLARCAPCRALVAPARATAHALLSAASLAQPPSEVRSRMLWRVRQAAEEERHGRAPSLWGQRMPQRAYPGSDRPRRSISRMIAGLLRRGPSVPDEPHDEALARLAELLAEPESVIWELAGTPETPGARARLVGARDGHEAVLVVVGLHPLAADRAYQVWLLRGGQPLPNALFTVGPQGEGRQVIHAPERLGAFDQVEVTPEPATGSSAPTGPIVLVGALA
jgi:anti-sigma-K factor RskA